MDTLDQRFKIAIYEQFARIGKALSSPRRLELLDLLCQGRRTVEALARESGLSVANTSQHLQILRTARLVEAQKEGLFVFYQPADGIVCEFFRTLRMFAESRLPEIEQIVRTYFEGHDALEPVDKEALLARVRSGEAIVLDVRPSEEYRAGHIPGALSVPLKDLESHLSELPRDQEIVAFCRGPYCIFAFEAVELLKAKGFRAVRLADSIQDWRSRGLPVTTGNEGQP